MRRRWLTMLFTVCIATLGAIGATPATAAPGGLVATFGTAGLSITSFDRGPSQANAAVVQPDGKIVVAGRSAIFEGEFAIIRYHADGSVDTSFGDTGRKVIPMGGNAGAGDIALAPDGKIVIVGSVSGLSGGFAVIRLQPNGSFDTSFSDDGKIILDSQFASGGAGMNGSGSSGVTVQPDGRILLAGVTLINGSSALAVARLTVDGSYDSSFSDDGKISEPQNASFTSALGLELQADGKVVLAGISDPNIVLYRYNADGTTDTAFGQDGSRRTTAGGSSQWGSLALGPHGKIVATRGRAIVRYTTAGDLDITFGSNGIAYAATSDMGSDAWTTFASIVQPDGKIVVGGTNYHDFDVRRYNADGTLDTAFAEDGTASTDFGVAGSGSLQDLTLDHDGRIITVGRGGRGPGSDFTVTRHTATGLSDTTFSTDGRVATSFLGSDTANDAAVQSDGKIVVVGDAGPDPYNWNAGEFGVARYLPDGTPDTTFAGTGRSSIDFGAPDTLWAEAVAIQPDGKIVVAGSASGDLAVTRLNTDGSLDPSFSDDGKQVIDLGWWGSDGARDIAIQPDGKIVLSGTIDNQFGLMRLNTDGSPDTSFSDDGKVQSTFEGPSTVGAAATAVAILPGGKIVAAGSGGTSESGIAIARYNANGSPDSSFDGDGRQQFNRGAFGQMRGKALAVQQDGKVLIGASDMLGAYLSPLLMRLTSTGALDQTFGIDGQQTIPYSGVGNPLEDIALRDDGTIAVVGTRGTYTDNTDVTVAKIRPDGAFDERFSEDGMTSFDFGGDDVGKAIEVLPDGDLVVAGSVTRTSLDFGVARIDGGASLPPIDVDPPTPTDTQPPTITITRPAEGQQFTQGQSVTSVFTCTDDRSNVVVCNGPSTVNTNTVGSAMFTVTAEDSAGNKTSRTVTYRVVAAPAQPDPPVIVPPIANPPVDPLPVPVKPVVSVPAGKTPSPSKPTPKRTETPTAKLSGSDIKRGQTLVIRLSGVPNKTRLVVQWNPSKGKVVRQTVKVSKQRVRVTGPKKAGRYRLTVSYGHRVLVKNTRVVVR